MNTEATRNSSVAFIGVGQMGRHIASNLIQSGYNVTIHDRRADARDDPLLIGANWADSPREATRASRFTIASLPGPAEVDAVVLGAHGVLAGAQPDDYFIDMSTSTPTAIRSIASLASSVGLHVLDAPVAGGVRGARKGSLTIMVGASIESFTTCGHLFEVLGTRVFHIGDVGSGHAAKLVNNMMSIGNALVAMEAIIVGTKAGVDPAVLIDVAHAGTGGSYALNIFPYSIFKRQFDPARFAFSLATKDLRISEEFAESLGINLRIIPSILEAMTDAEQASDLGQRDWTSYITLLEAEADVVVLPRLISQ